MLIKKFPLILLQAKAGGKIIVKINIVDEAFPLILLQAKAGGRKVSPRQKRGDFRFH